MQILKKDLQIMAVYIKYLIRIQNNLENSAEKIVIGI